VHNRPRRASCPAMCRARTAPVGCHRNPRHARCTTILGRALKFLPSAGPRHVY
jgi:hypothetical protein